MANDRLPNHSQMNELLRQNVLANIANDDTYHNNLERELAATYIAGRNGKVFATKIWNFKTNSTSAGERLRDSIGQSCAPSTDTVEGVDTFEDASQIFQWMRCNYVHDTDGTKRPIALEGRANFKTDGSVDVGPVAATFWWKIEPHGTYTIWYISDSPHPELGLIPWRDAVLADGTVLPFYVESAYYSVTASDGLLRSQPGIPAYNQSYNGQVSTYAKKGAGYFGTNVSRNALGMLFLVIKYATKNVQKFFAGCSNFNSQPDIAKAESNVKRVLLASQGVFNVGDCISVGTNTDRGNADCHSVVNRAIVKSVESVNVDGAQYTALNLDVKDVFSTVAGNKVSSMPCPSGQTDKVIGHRDGSLISNSDAHHSFRIHGMEFINGQGCIIGNAYVVKEDDSWVIYAAPKGVKTVANAHTSYAVAGKVPYNNGNDTWVGDVTIDETTGALVQIATGSGDSVGAGDRIWEGGQNLADGTAREMYTVGYLRYGSSAGLCALNLGYALSGGTGAAARAINLRY